MYVANQEGYMVGLFRLIRERNPSGCIEHTLGYTNESYAVNLKPSQSNISKFV